MNQKLSNNELDDIIESCERDIERTGGRFPEWESKDVLAIAFDLREIRLERDRLIK